MLVQNVEGNPDVEDAIAGVAISGEPSRPARVAANASDTEDDLLPLPPRSKKRGKKSQDDTTVRTRAYKRRAALICS